MILPRSDPGPAPPAVPVVGRDAELAALAERFTAARAGSGGLVVLSGPAGIGKTSLVSAAGHDFAAAGAVVLTGACPPGATIAYAPLLTAWRGAPGVDGGRGFGALLAEMAGLGQLPGEVAHAWLCDRILARVTAWTAERPVVLVVEDAHWIDPASAAVLELLAHAAASLPALLVVTARGEAGSTPPPPTLARLVELATATGGAHLALPPLSDDAVATVVRAAAPAPPDPGFVAAVVRRSGGNPMFACELARFPGSDLPVSLRLLLAQRLRALGPAGPAVVAAVSTADRAATDGLVAKVCHPFEPVQVEATLTAAIQDGLLVREPKTGGLRTRHCLVADVAAAELTPEQARRLHRALATALADEPVPPGMLAQAWEDAGEPARAVPGWLAEGRLATERAAYDSAAAAYRRALALLGNDVDRSEVVLATAQALRLAGATEEAIDLLRAELVGRRLPDAHRCLLLERLRDYLYAAGQSSAAFEALAQALRLLDSVDDAGLTARLTAAEAVRLMLTGRYLDGAASAAAAAAAAERAGEPEVRVRALSTGGVCLALSGDEGAGVTLLEDARRLAEAIGSMAGLCHAANNLTFVFANTSRYARAAAVSRETLDRLRAKGVESAFGADLLYNLAVSLVALGRWDELDARCSGPVPAKCRALLLLSRAEVAARRGAEGRAAALLAEAGGFDLDNGIVAVESAVVSAVAHREAGRFGPAYRACEQALARLTGVGPADRLRLAALALGALADLQTAGGRGRRVADAQAAADSLTETASQALAEWPPDRAPAEAAALAALCTAEASRLSTVDPEAWMDAVRGWDAAGMPWYSAYARVRRVEALAQRRSAGDGSAVILQEAYAGAAALGAEPLRRLAERVARRARIPLAAESGAETGPADTLSRREREVLALVCLGRTDREIAAELVISVRTASVHVSRLLAKLGAANRAEAGHLGRHLSSP